MEIYHKSSCITCKKEISGIEKIKKDTKKRDFFKEPLSEAELTKIFKISEQKPSECLRKRDKMYKDLSLGDNKKTQKELIRLMARYPGLILRPIIIFKGKAYFGKLKPDILK